MKIVKLVVPGKPVPWAEKVRMGKHPGAPRVLPAKQEAHAGKIRTEWERVGPSGIWLEKGTPLWLFCAFYVCRPKTAHYRSGRLNRELKPDAPEFPTSSPDLSNLVKLVEDAFTGTVWADDDAVVNIAASKHYVDWWEQPRSEIVVHFPVST